MDTNLVPPWETLRFCIPFTTSTFLPWIKKKILCNTLTFRHCNHHFRAKYPRNIKKQQKLSETGLHLVKLKSVHLERLNEDNHCISVCLVCSLCWLCKPSLWGYLRRFSSPSVKLAIYGAQQLRVGKQDLRIKVGSILVAWYFNVAIFISASFTWALLGLKRWR